MNANLRQLLYPGLAFLLLQSGCSGGGINVSIDGPVIPPIPAAQTSEAITSYGEITGLGDVTVNDVRYTASSATVTINGQPGTLVDLRRGQIVMVSGRTNSLGQSGTADSILFDASLIGPVENLDTANGRITAMGQSLIVDEGTRFGAGIDPASFAGLAVGSIVQVSGYRDAAGAIKATWIDLDLANNEYQLIGEVAGHDLANLLFTIDRLTVDYSNAVLIDLPGGAPSNGMMLKVIGTMSGGLFNVERVYATPDLAGNNGQRVQAAGVITRFSSSTDFEINNTAASVNAGTAFLNGDAGDLALNAELIIDGDFAAGGRISANRITFGHLLHDTTTLSFDFSNFTEISVPTVFNVTVTQGPDFSVEVTVDEEAVNRIDVTQIGPRLNIALIAGNGSIQTLDAHVTMPVLNYMDLTGVVNATLNDFNQPMMTVNVGGVSRLYGNALTIDHLTASVSGVSQLAFGDIHPIGKADIDINSVSQATLNMGVGSTMTGSVGTGQGTGVSTLFYYGTNVTVDIATDFLSSVIKLGETRP